MIVVRMGPRVFEYSTAWFVETTDYCHNIWDTKTKQTWIASAPLSAIVENAPGISKVVEKVQLGLFE